MKQILLILVLSASIFTVSHASLMGGKWQNAIAGPLSIENWVDLALFSVLQWLHPILAGVLKVVCIELMATMKTADPYGIAP